MYKPEYEQGSTPLDPNEIDGLRLKYIETQAQVNEAEYANITQAELWLRRLRRLDTLSEEFTLQLHKKMFGEVWDWAGTYRRTGKTVGIDAAYIQVELYKLIDNAKYWHSHKIFEPLEAAARFHHQLTFIHPFPNGNGRHARFMADAFLKNYFGAGPVNWGRANEMQNSTTHRNSYIAALRAADHHDYKPLLDFMGGST